MTNARFFISDRLKAGTLSFDGSEFHHMVRVTRHQVGDHVGLFDGSGREAEAEITFISRHSATLKVGKVSALPEESGPRLVLAVAVPKAARATWLVEKSVELGVSEVVPLSTSRAVVDPRPTKMEGLRENVIAASKQCGRSRLMTIAPSTTLSELLDQYSTTAAIAFAHPGGAHFSHSLVQSMLDEAPAGRKKGTETRPTVVVAIGPEGGFTVEEVSLAVTRGARLVGLGSRILRVETAAIFVASVFDSATAGQ